MPSQIKWWFFLDDQSCRICESLSFLSFIVLSATAADTAAHNLSPVWGDLHRRNIVMGVVQTVAREC